MIRARGAGDRDDIAMTKGEYDALRDSDPRPWPEPYRFRYGSDPRPWPEPYRNLLDAIEDAPDESWRQRAACHQDNRDRPLPEWVELWFPDNGGRYAEARAICDGCPVRDECREAGADEKFGMWGGDDNETRALARSNGLPPMTRHGYPFGAQAHRRRGEKPCDECMEVQRQYELAYRAKRKAAA